MEGNNALNRSGNNELCTCRNSVDWGCGEWKNGVKREQKKMSDVTVMTGTCTKQLKKETALVVISVQSSGFGDSWKKQMGKPQFSKRKWRSHIWLAVRVPWSSALWPCLFPANINGQNVGNKLIEFADGTKTKIEVTSEQQVKFRTDLDLLFKVPQKKQMKKLHVYNWSAIHIWLQNEFMTTN